MVEFEHGCGLDLRQDFQASELSIHSATADACFLIDDRLRLPDFPTHLVECISAWKIDPGGGVIGVQL